MSKEQMLARIHNKDIVLAVIGLGYVGLPLAVEFAKGGLHVVGIDLDPKKVSALKAGHSYIPDVPAADVAALVRSGYLSATTDYSVLQDCEAVSICVPTPLNKSRDPDMSYVIEAASQVAAYCHPNFLIVLESTTYPGTTDEILRPKVEAAGFEIGQEVFLGFSPERIDPGNTKYLLRNTPKIVGGATPACVEVAVALYRVAVDTVVPVSSLRTAEMVKLLENTFRAVNIGLINEMALMCDKLDVDVWEVIDAAATKPYGFMKFTPGPGIGGHCLSGAEYVFVKDGTGVKALSLQDFWVSLTEQGLPQLVQQPSLQLYAPNGCQVLSYDPDHGAMVFRPLQFVSRREYHGQMVELRTADGRHLRVTDEHPMMVFEHENLNQRPAAALKAGDELIVPTGPIPGQCPGAIDLIAHLSGEIIGRIRVKPKSACYADHDELLRPLFLGLGESPRDVYRQNVMPLATYLALEAIGSMPILRSEVMLATGRGPSYNVFPALVEMNAPFARLVGYYLSEGCLTDSGTTRVVRFTFNRNETETIADLTQILDGLGVHWSLYQEPHTQADHIKVSSSLFAFLLNDLLRCGTDCYTMRVPDTLMDASEGVRWALLTGLFRGDGDVDHNNRRRVYSKNGRLYNHSLNTGSVGYFSSSPVLFQQVNLLLQSFSLLPTFRSTRPHLRLYGAKAMGRMASVFLDAKRVRIDACLRNRIKPMGVRQSRQHSGFATVRVQSVKEAPAEPAVYSLEVEGTHTFITSYGLLVHNCIPIDPLYLSWKLKSLNYTARFIELADSVNSRMPEYVVSLIADALNDDGRALNGANVLIVGVAYKPDTNDVRESPALDVIATLLKHKARVTYHDPYVERVVMDGINLQSQALTPETLRAADCVVITAGHTTLDWALVPAHARVVVDTRNALKGRTGPARVVRL